jgi:DNA-binding response OmpR family regulator
VERFADAKALAEAGCNFFIFLHSPDNICTLICIAPGRRARSVLLSTASFAVGIAATASRKGICMKRRILLVDDEVAVLLTMKAVLEISGFEVETAASAREGKHSIRTHEYDMVITDMRMESDEAGREVVREARTAVYHPAVALLTAFPVDDADWQSLGAHKLLLKPMHTRVLLEQIEHLFETHQQKLAALASAAPPPALKTAVKSAAKKAVKKAAKKVAVKVAAKKAAKKVAAKTAKPAKKAAKKAVKKKAAKPLKKASKASKPAKKAAVKFKTIRER